MTPHTIDEPIVETPRDARGAENSKNSFYVLKVSLALAVLAGIACLFYFGVITGFEQPGVQPTAQ